MAGMQIEANPIRAAIAAKPIGTTPIEAKPTAPVHVQRLQLGFSF
jgi:hypothetical protein